MIPAAVFVLAAQCGVRRCNRWRGRQSKSPAVDSSECRLDLDLCGRGRSAVWLSNACHRSTRPIQNALSLALRAVAARRRHSSARRRNSSKITSRPSADRPTLPFSGRGYIHKPYQILNRRILNFSRGMASVVKLFGSICAAQHPPLVSILVASASLSRARKHARRGYLQYANFSKIAP
jgi:hypothetical protein